MRRSAKRIHARAELRPKKPITKVIVIIIIVIISDSTRHGRCVANKRQMRK